MWFVTDECQKCGCQIHREGGVWIDNSGGDVCGVNGENDPHVPHYDETKDSGGMTHSGRVEMQIWILVCVNREFGTETVATHVFTNNREAIAAVDSADINCDGWHVLHAHTIDPEG